MLNGLENIHETPFGMHCIMFHSLLDFILYPPPKKMRLIKNQETILQNLIKTFDSFIAYFVKNPHE